MKAASFTSTCSGCGKPLPVAAPEGLCPRCVSSALIAPVPAQSRSVEEIKGQRFFGDYELLEEVARGGMGIVFKARQLGVNRLVALKVLAGGAASGHEFVHRFHNEAAAAARLDHPHIVPVYEFGEHESAHFLAMQFMEGGTLQQHFAKNRATPREAGQVMQAVARAVEHAHARGVLHRDLKPGNVLLDSNDGPRVGDFGLARVVEDESSLTLSRAVLGTAAYMAPEIAVGGAACATTASDVYGLGAILYELLTGQPPFSGASLPALLQKLAVEEPIAPRRLNPSVPRDLETICLTCLEKDPGQRYSSASEVADELGRFLADEPIKACPISSAERLWRWAKRKPALAALGTAALALVSVVAIGAPLAIFRIESARRQAEARAYTSNMNLVQQLAEEGNFRQARTLLRAHVPAPGRPDLRGFEWRYLWTLCSDQSTRAFRLDAPVVLRCSQGDQFLAAKTKHSVIRLDPISGAATNLISDSDDEIWTFAFSPVTTLLATGGAAGQIKLWDLDRHQLVASLGHDTRPLLALAFSPDGQQLASVAADASELRLWDVAGRSNIWTRTTVIPPQTVGFAPDGKTLVSGGGDEAGNLLIWDRKGNATAFPAEHQGWIYHLAWSPDGELLATASADGTSIIWDFMHRTALRRIDSSGPLAFSPGGDAVAIASGSRLGIWEVASGKRKSALYGHEGEIISLAFSNDSRWLFSGSMDRTLRVWDWASRPGVRVLRGHSNWIPGIAFSPDGQRLASINFHTPYFARIWDLASGQALTNLLGANAPLGQCAFSPDGALFAVGCSDQTVRLWDAQTFALATVLTNDFPGHALAFSHDSRVLGVATPQLRALEEEPKLNRLAFWDLRTRKRILTLAACQTNASAVAFGQRSDRVAVGYYDGTVRIWDSLETPRPNEFRSDTSLIWSLAFSPDDSLLASGGSDGRVALYDLRARKALPPLIDDAGVVWSLAFAPDGKTLASASGDSKIRLWNLLAGEAALVLTGHRGPVTGVRFTPDGLLMASSGADGVIRLWPAPSFAEIERGWSSSGTLTPTSRIDPPLSTSFQSQSNRP